MASKQNSPKSRKQKATKAAPSQAKQNACMCGCGGATAREFMPGHDGRLKGHLLRAFRGEEKLPARVAKVYGTADPLAIAKARGWGRFMTKPE